MPKPMYAISATRDSALAQSGQAKLLKYESDYYGNYVEIASGDFHEMSELAKTLNTEVTVKASPFRPNPPMPSDVELSDWFNESIRGNNPSFMTGLRAVWRAGCDAGMTTPKEN